MASCCYQTEMLLLAVVGLLVIAQTVTILSRTSCIFALKLWPLITYELFFITRVYEIRHENRLFEDGRPKMYFGVLFSLNLAAAIAGVYFYFVADPMSCLEDASYVFLIVAVLCLVRLIVFALMALRFRRYRRELRRLRRQRLEFLVRFMEANAAIFAQLEEEEEEEPPQQDDEAMGLSREELHRI